MYVCISDSFAVHNPVILSVEEISQPVSESYGCRILLFNSIDEAHKEEKPNGICQTFCVKFYKHHSTFPVNTVYCTQYIIGIE